MVSVGKIYTRAVWLGFPMDNEYSKKFNSLDPNSAKFNNVLSILFFYFKFARRAIGEPHILCNKYCFFLSVCFDLNKYYLKAFDQMHFQLSFFYFYMTSF